MNQLRIENTVVMPVQLSSLEPAFAKGTCQLNVPHRQRDFEMILISEGTGVHIVNGEKYPLRKNVMYAALADQEHELHIYADTRGYNITFHVDQINRFTDDYMIGDQSYLYHYFSRNPILELSDEQALEIHHVISLIEKEFFNNVILQREVICKYFQIFQLYLRRYISNSSLLISDGKNNVILNGFLKLLERNFKEKKSVLDYAIELNVTPSHLNYIIKKSTGYPTSYHIQQRIVQEAKRRAKHSGASMKEVAYYLGFNDMGHFSKFFKNMSGMSFTDYKRLAANSQ